MFDMRYPISNQTTNALLEPVHGIEGPDYERLFVTGIPHC